jgi:hypothetical protein
MMNSASQTEIREPKRRLIKLWAALLALSLAAALMAACNGGGNGESSPTAQPTGEGSPTSQPTGEGSPTSQPTEQAVTSPSCQALASLKSYRYVSNVTLDSPEEIVSPSEGQPTPVATLTREFTGPFHFEYNIDASVVAPDRIDALVTTGVGEPFNMIAIGDQSWATFQGEWQEVAPQYGIPYKPLDVCSALFPQLDLSQAQGEKETVNDVAALHYAFAAIPPGEAIAGIFGPGSDMDVLFQTMTVEVWVAEKGDWPVRMDVQSSGLYGDGRELSGHVRIELRDINDEDIKVEPPI